MAIRGMIKFGSLLLLAALLAGAWGWDGARAAANDQPVYGTAVVDGSIAEWDLEADLFSPLYWSGVPEKNKPILGSAYLRYDCANGTLYLLVLSKEGRPLLDDPAESWVRNGAGQVLVDGNAGADGAPPDFAWYRSGETLLGWEASFQIAPAPDPTALLIQTKVWAEEAWQTASTTRKIGVDVNLFCTDFGDLPASFGITRAADNGARHQIGALSLGSLVDGETDGAESAGAVGDDYAAWDDGDGVSVVSAVRWTPGAAVSLRAEVRGGGGFLAAWFDWDGSGTFSGPQEAARLWPVSAGENLLDLTVPETYQTGRSLYARFRLYAGEPDTPAPTGEVVNGEVEDYLWSFTPTAVSLSSFQASSSGQPVYPWLLLPAAAALGMVWGARRRAR